MGGQEKNDKKFLKAKNYRIIREFVGKTQDEVVKGLSELMPGNESIKQNVSAWENLVGNPGPKFIDPLSSFLEVPAHLLSMESLTKEYLENNFSGKNNTQMPKPNESNGKTDPSIEEAIRNLIEGNTEYILMHKVVILDKYRLVSVEDLDKADKELERKQDQITGLYEIIKTITSKLPEPVKLPEIQKT